MTTALGGTEIAVTELRTADVRQMLAAGHLADWSDNHLPAPSIVDLVTFAEVSGRTTMWLLFSAGDEQVALLALEIGRRRVHYAHVQSLHAAGGDFFDYLRLFCKDAWRLQVLAALRVKARSYGVDVVFLENLVRPQD